MIAGLDNAGKTTILYRLLNQRVTATPTRGFNVETLALSSGSAALTLWDIDADGVVFVVDGADHARMDEALGELDSIVSMGEDRLGKEVPILVFVNKLDAGVDLAGDAVFREFTRRMSALADSGASMRQWHVQRASAQSGDGLHEGFEWLSGVLKSVRYGLCSTSDLVFDTNAETFADIGYAVTRDWHRPGRNADAASPNCVVVALVLSPTHGLLMERWRNMRVTKGSVQFRRTNGGMVKINLPAKRRTIRRAAMGWKHVIRDESTGANCPAAFDWMQNSNGLSPCELAGYVRHACDQNTTSTSTDVAPLPPLQPNSSYPLPTSSNVCTCSWAYYNLISACSACQGGNVPAWTAYQRACGSSTFASAWSGAVSYFPPNVALTDHSQLPYWASINPAKWARGMFDLAAARKMRNQGHQESGFTAPACSAGFEWMKNENGLSACEVAASIQGTCSDSTVPVELPPLTDPSLQYKPPSNDLANDCSCSFVSYNLYSACMLCQNPTTQIPTFEAFTAACGSATPTAETRYYPDYRALPSVPSWATMNPFDFPSNGAFYLDAARNSSEQGHRDVFQNPSLPSGAPPINTLVDMTVGALEVGVLVSIFLFGIITKQTISYYNRYPLDPLKLKILVAVIWTLEFAHAIALSHGTYTATVDLAIAPATISVGFLFSGIIGAIVQAYFSLRIRILSGNRVFSFGLVLLAILRFISWIIVGVIGSLPADNLSPSVTDAWRWMLTGLLVANAIVDFGITLYFWVFYRSKQKDSFRSTVKLLGRLIQWTLQNGLITSVAGILTAVFFHTSYDSSLWVAIFAVLTRLFSNSFLASVNARDRLRNITTSYTNPDSIQTTLFFAQPSEPRRVDLFERSNPQHRDSSQGTF
ncbi:hypothetical protein ONZ45_g10096 [Pleurotus djamor]|nr:hypothetical protein ONZ45_g10096 [Pleurotus djamor]